MNKDFSISKARELGYKDGQKEAQIKLNQGYLRKLVANTEPPHMKQFFSTMLGCNRDKAARFNSAYGFGFDDGVRDAIFYRAE